MDAINKVFSDLGAKMGSAFFARNLQIGSVEINTLFLALIALVIAIVAIVVIAVCIVKIRAIKEGTAGEGKKQRKADKKEEAAQE